MENLYIDGFGKLTEAFDGSEGNPLNGMTFEVLEVPITASSENAILRAICAHIHTKPSRLELNTKGKGSVVHERWEFTNGRVLTPAQVARWKEGKTKWRVNRIKYTTEVYIKASFTLGFMP